MNISSEYFQDLVREESPQIVPFGDTEIPLVFKKGSIDTLVVSFHGSMNRKARAFPFYQPFLRIGAHQLSIADPTLLNNDNLVAGWFVGTERQDLVSKLSRLIMSLSKHLGCRRTVYVGGSSGGFAALLYSWHDPRSIAVVANPQTQLQSYVNTNVAKFMKTCWPSVRHLDDFSKIATIDLPKLYAQRFDNTVVYIQSSGDSDHIHDQLGPFLAAIPESARDRFILDVGFWDVLGHSGSVPPNEYIAWVRTALASPTWTLGDLLRTHSALQGRSKGTSILSPSEANTTAGNAPADLRLADLLRDLHLQS